MRIGCASNSLDRGVAGEGLPPEDAGEEDGSGGLLPLLAPVPGASEDGLEMANPLTVLGIETSCDETATAILKGRPGDIPEIRAHVVRSQIDAHQLYGGVVPEIAARAHIEALDACVEKALAQAGLGFEDIDGFAVTAGPGLIGGVIVGLMTAKGLAAYTGKPLIAVNHLEGHALSIRITEPVAFPYLLLLVSGGHCQLLSVEGLGRYTLYGETIDDAVGEAFDKTAKLMGLPYPGGPAIEAMAKRGDPERFALPRPLIGGNPENPGQHHNPFAFSFSGLKTAVRRQLEQAAHRESPDGPLLLDDQVKADMAASFQAAAGDVLVDRTRNALERFRDETGERGTLPFVVAGGVAANETLRTRLTALCAAANFSMHAPPLSLCTDNGAMIAWAGLERLAAGQGDPLSVSPRARWPLTEMAALPTAKG